MCNLAAMDAAYRQGKRFKTRKTFGDAKVRPSHKAANGQRVPLDMPFTVGGYEMMFPNDSSLGAPAGEAVNCRCVLEFDDGKVLTNSDERGIMSKSDKKGSKGLTKNEAHDIIKLRINLFDKADPIYLDTFGIEEEDGFEDICIHGNSGSVQIIVDGKPMNMSAEEFAALLKDNPLYRGGDIRLAACSAGKGENSFAQQLSKALGVTVKAPDDDVYYAPDEGVFFVGSPYTNTGRWRIFKNGDEVL